MDLIALNAPKSGPLFGTAGRTRTNSPLPARTPKPAPSETVEPLSRPKAPLQEAADWIQAHAAQTRADLQIAVDLKRGEIHIALVDEVTGEVRQTWVFHFAPGAAATFSDDRRGLLLNTRA